jgi:zinc transporter ZupT
MTIYSNAIHRGIEAVARSNPSSLPTSHIALSLLLGFAIMLILEQLILPQSHQTHGDLALHNVKGISDNHYPRSTIEFDADAEMGDPEGDQVPRAGYLQADVPIPNTPHDGGADASVKAAFPLTFGLVIHGIADGLALGVSSLSSTNGTAGSGLSFIVFLALLVHKGQPYPCVLWGVFSFFYYYSPDLVRTDHISACHVPLTCKVQKTPGILQCLDSSQCYRILSGILLLW